MTNTKNDIKTRKVAYVVACTGCTEEDARLELEAEDWCEFDALINIRADRREATSTLS